MNAKHKAKDPAFPKTTRKDDLLGLNLKFSSPKKNAESNTLVLTKVESNAADTEAMLWVVAQVYTMPDGQDGLKIQRVR